MITKKNYTAWLVAAILASGAAYADNQTISHHRNTGTTSNTSNSTTSDHTNQTSSGTNRSAADKSASGDFNSANQSGGKISGNRYNADQVSRNRAGSTSATSNKWRTNEAYRGQTTMQPFNGTTGRNVNHQNGVSTNDPYFQDGNNSRYETRPSNDSRYGEYKQGSQERLDEKLSGPESNPQTILYNNNGADADLRTGKFEKNDPRYRRTWQANQGTSRDSDRANGLDNRFNTSTDKDIVIGAETSESVSDRASAQSVDSSGAIMLNKYDSTGSVADGNADARSSSIVYDSTGRPINSETTGGTHIIYDSNGNPASATLNAKESASQPERRRSWVSRMFSRRSRANQTATSNTINASATNGGVGSTTTNWSQGNTNTNWSANGVYRTADNNIQYRREPDQNKTSLQGPGMNSHGASNNNSNPAAANQ
ncbi:hypothetical protein BH09SUM1_BH09SUM1_23160 [soil metagenome]